MSLRWFRCCDQRPGHERSAPRAALWLFLAASACTVARVPSGPAPAPQPTSPAPTHVPAPQPVTTAQTTRGGGPWQYTPAAGTYSYVLSTDAQIDRVGASAGDTSAASRIFPPTTQRVTLAIFSTGDVQLVDPPAPVSGAPCDAAAALATRALALVPRVPATLNAGTTWSDSSTTQGCRGTIPTTTHTQSRYRVIGDTTIGGLVALQVRRTDTITANGEGAQEQHRITLAATGSGSTELYLDLVSGRFLGSDQIQETTVAVSTSGRTERFLQHVRERATLAPGTSVPTP